MVGVWDVILLVGLNNVVVADAVSRGHGEVRARGEDYDQSGHNMVETLALRKVLIGVKSKWMQRPYDWDIPGHAGEDDRGNKHYHEDNPGVRLALSYSGIIAVQCRGSFEEPQARHDAMRGCWPLFTWLFDAPGHWYSCVVLTIVSSHQYQKPPGTLGAVG